MIKGVAIIFAVALAVVYLAATPGEAISCGEMTSQLMPCVGYAIGGGGEPSQSCCGGVRSVAGSLQSKQDRQTACNCFVSAITSYNVQPDAISSLPGKCGVNFGAALSPSMDCSQIS